MFVKFYQSPVFVFLPVAGGELDDVSRFRFTGIKFIDCDSQNDSY